ncbi:MAG: FAD-dependent oxidoreductase [Lunatimonas sp.]|uniref:NAD(P)/FAD-dependent oxidoreductase n=1 Tax=Lunatimonas sp. TaxID=2060141 RepID=UPI00263BBC38|nr:FAD-dependent oxidoreductase [Lunatimonas sp.]MCC5938738.1 FAD-dependent oxidoreductase [Lunatimonas sp.]
MKTDFLLIGQGLAGTVLSWRLLAQGHRVHLVDTPGLQKSSRVAAGLYNPITGRKMVKTWAADLHFPAIEPFYRSMEERLGQRFLEPKPIYRPFLNVEEQNEWMGHSSRDEFRRYLLEIRTTSRYEAVNDPYGGVLLDQCGYLNIPNLLDAYAAWLEEEGLLTREVFDESKLTFHSKGVAYGDIEARSIVYTNGLGAMESRYFSWLPFRPVRGEILSVAQSFSPDEIINRGVFRITLSGGLHRVGSTYDNNDLDSGATEKGKSELLEKLRALINPPLTAIHKHEWGIRPATKDRKPFLGRHPSHNQLYIFNGLGAKGVSMAPYLSIEMSNLLTFNKEPSKEVNINRFFKYI